jgi:hypothetical protein
MKWLAREGIAEREYDYCLEKSKALVYPNENGLRIRSRLKQSDAELKAKPYIAGLKLVSALSIGRWMTYQPDHCYMVTTVASLFTHHDMGYTSEAICDMLLDEGHRDTGTSIAYRCGKSRLLPVVSKIVESITLNVVNCSGNPNFLPEKIREICGHTVDSHAFAAAAMAIYRSSGHVIIRCNRFLADLYLWLLTHIEGDISVSIAGKIIHRATFGNPQRSVTMLADEACSGDHGQITSTFVVSTEVGDSFQTLLRFIANRAQVYEPRINFRQPLYDLKDYSREGRLDAGLDDRELHEIRMAGQCIVRWLMALPAIAGNDSHIVYRTQLDGSPVEAGMLTVESLLSRWPAICNLDLGPEPSKHSPESSDYQEDAEDLDGKTLTISHTLSSFPEAWRIIKRARIRCRCRSCRHVLATRDECHGIESKPGCLVYLAENHFVLIIAHAVSDGFGVPDASNLGDFLIIRNGVQKLMQELLRYKQIKWATWFSLAACTYLGCQWVGEREQYFVKREKYFVAYGKNSTELVAVQHGSEVIVAPWVDISSELSPQGSFACFIATGHLSEMDTDFGALYTEGTGRPAVANDGWRLPEWHLRMVNSEISLQNTITGMSGSLFRLTVYAKAGDYTRIVNPASALLATIRSEFPNCNHEKGGVHDFALRYPSYKLWPAEDALGLWFDPSLPGWSIVEYAFSRNSTHCTAVGTLAQCNILLALLPSGCVVKRDDCCLTCAAKSLGKGLYPHSKRIICLTKRAKQEFGAWQHRIE